jgi:tetratricopeptide (TPR) repeat protein
MRAKALNTVILGVVLFASTGSLCQGQRGTPPSRTSGFTLFGDVEVSGTDESDGRSKTLLFDLLLYTRSGVLIDRQRVGSKGRYRFLNVPAGDYELVIEYENTEVARTQIKLIGNLTDVRQDLSLEWRRSGNSPAPKPATVSAGDAYDRKPPNTGLFQKAEDAFNKKDYERALALLKQVVENDPGDYQAWTEVGTIYSLQKNTAEAEASYLKAVDARPTFSLALLNLGRLRVENKKYQEAVAPLTSLLEINPQSPDGNLFLGEAYLQIKKGSKAVPYLNAAAKLGRPEAHLRLATLYDAVGLKDKAAAEFEAFLRKKPDYPDRQKLEAYISMNAKH